MTLTSPISIVLADDHVMVRQSLASVLEASGEVMVVGQAGDGIELQEQVKRLRPGVLVMDYSMPNHDPGEIIKTLLKEVDSLKILVLTVHENAHYAVRVIEAGAHGYLIKSSAVEELVGAIRTIHSGDVYISKKISPDVWAQLRRPKGSREGIEGLSQREFEVLRLIGQGANLQQCAQQLDISVSSVSTYRSRILQKLSLRSTGEVVRFAIENKIVE